MDVEHITEKDGSPFLEGGNVRIDIDPYEPVSFSPVSREGYYHNPKRVEETTERLADLLNFEAGDKCLDVGYGTNPYVSKRLAEMGLRTYGVDLQAGDGEDSEGPPEYLGEKEHSMKVYRGLIERVLEEGSDLKDERFDEVIFWGSWNSGGNNWTVTEIASTKLMDGDLEKPDPEEMESVKYRALSTAREILRPVGGILNVSSRYSYHGAGFPVVDYPDEKVGFLMFLDNLKKLGASKSYVIGISKDKTKEGIERSLEEVDFEPGENLPPPTPREDYEEVIETLTDDSRLFESEPSARSRTIEERSERLIGLTDIGRIDAVYTMF